MSSLKIKFEYGIKKEPSEDGSLISKYLLQYVTSLQRLLQKEILSQLPCEV
jgi:hypothetical protein